MVKGIVIDNQNTLTNSDMFTTIENFYCCDGAATAEQDPSQRAKLVWFRKTFS